MNSKKMLVYESDLGLYQYLLSIFMNVRDVYNFINFTIYQCYNLSTMKGISKSNEKKVKANDCPNPSISSSKSKISKKISISTEDFVIRKVGVFDDDYIVVGELGEGSFGKVYKVYHKILKMNRALKTIKKRKTEHFSSFEEIEILKKLDHPSILKIY
eukprot:GHVR01161201.1.p1 GENE.GHVR01161201.1~~GHVR01161201.1.p1  ORF type:complete len:158 (-),score=2.70 GHVR01161201.1:2993-3466(-)